MSRLHTACIGETAPEVASKYTALSAHLFLVLLAAMYSGQLLAKSPGSMPGLGRDQGYLAVVVDTDNYLHTLELDRSDGRRGGRKLRRVSRGRSIHLLRLPAGTYRWGRMDAALMPKLGRFVEENTFKHMAHRFSAENFDGFGEIVVEAGALNYAGDLHLRFRGGMVWIAMPNRSAQMLQSLVSQWRYDIDRAPLRWAGEGGDPYPEWLREHRSPAEAAKGEQCPNPRALPMGRPSAEDLFRPSQTLALKLSPGGALLLRIARDGERHGLHVIDPQTGHSMQLYEGLATIAAADWAGPRQVAMHLFAPSGVNRVHVFDIPDVPLIEAEAKRIVLPLEGWVVDSLPNNRSAIVFATPDRQGTDSSHVFLLNIDQGDVSLADLHPNRRINHDFPGSIDWLVDRNGRIRVAEIESPQSTRLVIVGDRGGESPEVVVLNKGALTTPAAIESDGRVLLLSSIGRDQVELVRVDPRSPGKLQTVFQLPGIDLSGVMRSSRDGQVLGVQYYDEGLPRVVYLDPEIERWEKKLLDLFPQQSARFVDIDMDSRTAVVVVTDDATPPQYYWYDVETNRISLVEKASPWLSGQPFIHRQVRNLRTDQGHTLQLLLAVPDSDGPVPVLVMPHGGPYLVQDVLEFDPMVQYWATRGFAVLQVNFRGSGGFGVEHFAAGLQQFGAAIEDDIEAALTAVLADTDRFDKTRVCAIGSSYGGYSALMLALRRPDAFRCAVSINGPTDLPLLFTSSDWSSDARVLRSMKAVIGDPSSPELQERSPLYRSSEFSVPALLIHGAVDRRVELEHSLRFAAALSHYNKTHRLIVVEDMAHGSWQLGHSVCVHGAAEQFIREHLSVER